MMSMQCLRMSTWECIALAIFDVTCLCLSFGRGVEQQLPFLFLAFRWTHTRSASTGEDFQMLLHSANLVSGRCHSK